MPRTASHLHTVYAAWSGNAEALGADIGAAGVTVRQWRNRGNIPPRYWPRIIAAAKARGILLEWTDFLPPDALFSGACTGGDGAEGVPHAGAA